MGMPFLKLIVAASDHNLAMAMGVQMHLSS
jgi:hypothetical protein